MTMTAATWPSSAQLIPQLAGETGGKCLLSFSTGKDSVATWLALRPHFPVIVPVYFAWAPGLEFVERTLQYYEAWFGTRIIRLPHPRFLGLLAAGAFQTPVRLPAIDALPTTMDAPHWDDYFDVLRHDHQLGGAFVMNGVRAVDSLTRRAHIRKHGPVNRKRLSANPIYDWTMDRVRTTIKLAGIHLPVDYEWFGRSFDGLYYRYLAPIRRHAPADYARICEWFPLLPAILARGLQVYGRPAHA